MDISKGSFMTAFQKYSLLLAIVISGTLIVPSVAAEPPGSENALTESEAEGGLDENLIRVKSVTAEGVTLSIEVPAQLIAGAENLITLRLQNRTDTKLVFLPSTGQYGGPFFEVLRKQKPIPKTTYGTRCLELGMFPKLPEMRVIEPKEEICAIVNLTRFYDLSVDFSELQISAAASCSFDGSFKDFKRLITPTLSFAVKAGEGESVKKVKLK